MPPSSMDSPPLPKGSGRSIVGCSCCQRAAASVASLGRSAIAITFHPPMVTGSETAGTPEGRTQCLRFSDPCSVIGISIHTTGKSV
jgi:hypothetical protein